MIRLPEEVLDPMKVRDNGGLLIAAGSMSRVILNAEKLLFVCLLIRVLGRSDNIGHLAPITFNYDT